MQHEDWQAITLAEQQGSLSGWIFPPGRTTSIHFVPDIHYPYHRRDVLTHIIDLCHTKDVIVQIGDGVDCYQGSNFDRNPARKTTISQEGRGYGDAFWRVLKKINPTARKIQIEGNHEQRLKRLLWQKVPELADNPDLTWRRMMRLDEYDVEWVTRSGLLIAGLRAKHGDVAKAGAGLSARAEMEAHRSSGISGHTHRWGEARRTDKEGVTTEWREIGHACDTDLVEYGDAMDWNLSAGLSATIHDDGHIEWTGHRLT